MTDRNISATVITGKYCRMEESEDGTTANIMYKAGDTVKVTEDELAGHSKQLKEVS